jgi:hypothetical protein
MIIIDKIGQLSGPISMELDRPCQSILFSLDSTAWYCHVTILSAMNLNVFDVQL